MPSEARLSYVYREKRGYYKPSVARLSQPSEARLCLPIEARLCLPSEARLFLPSEARLCLPSEARHHISLPQELAGKPAGGRFAASIYIYIYLYIFI